MYLRIKPYLMLLQQIIYYWLVIKTKQRNQPPIRIVKGINHANENIPDN